MKKLTAMAGALALLVVAGAGAQVLRPQYADAVAVAAQSPLVRGTEARFAVELRIQPGYHANANPPSEDWLIPTRVELAGVEGVSLLEAFYPEGEKKQFAFWTGPLSVYEGSIVVGVVLRVDETAELGDTDLVFDVEYQACNDEACFAPAKARTVLPVVVAPAGSAARPLESPLLRRARFEQPAS